MRLHRRSALTGALLSHLKLGIGHSTVFGHCGLAIALMWLAGRNSLLAQEPSSPAQNHVRVLAIEGEREKVEVSRAGSVAWDPAYVNQILEPGDRGRTGPRSRATLGMSDLSVLRVKERSQFEIKPP